jgi:SAM-dependent methyltransferase
MRQPFYQSHEGVAGMTDTAARWERLRIPEKLEGSRVLDISCNEGLISHWCSERGTTEVIGIDFDNDRIVFANKHYARDNVHFLHQRWNDLPAGSFDLVLWTSAMHYEIDPKNILMNIKSRLSPSGLLILECGVIQWPGREMIPYARQSDIRFYPTKDFLEKWLLADFSIREVSPPEPLLGEPVPRAVYHCRPRVPTVVFVIGRRRQVRPISPIGILAITPPR